MFVVIAGGGKAGRHLARLLLEKEYEVMIVEQDRRRYQRLDREFEDMAMMGDATEIFILERAGIERADVVAAVTGDDEDNIIICQVARHNSAFPRPSPGSTTRKTRKPSTCWASSPPSPPPW
ncbi:MAG: potassium channel family protein [Thermoleophilia bacterium]